MRGSTLQHISCVVIVLLSSVLFLPIALAQDAVRLGELESPVDRQALKAQETAGRDRLKILLENPVGTDIQLLRVNPEIVNEATDKLSVPLADGRLVSFQLRNYTAPMSPGDNGVENAAVKHIPAAYWFGDISPDDKGRASAAPQSAFDTMNFIFLARRGESLRGQMVVNGRLYLLEDVGNGQHGLMATNTALELPCEVLENEPEARRNVSGNVAAKSGTEAIHNINVLLVTTPRTNQMINPSAVDIMMDQIKLYNNLNNQGQGLSLNLIVVHKFASGARDNLLHRGKKILSDFRNSETDETKKVSELRDRYKADIVIVGAYNVDSKEVTYQGARKNTAFFVFNITTPHSFLHGIGHLLGVRHVWKDGDLDFDPSYQHGYLTPVYEGKRYASIGFDPKDCTDTNNCQYLYRYSTPKENQMYWPFGDAVHGDEIRRLNERAVEVENFY
jgi:hypothetical protein